MRKIIGALLVMGICSVICGATVGMVYAQGSDEKREEFVYGVNAFNGSVYHGTFIPPSVDTLYLLADEISIVSPRTTLLYYWPVTNEYKADWDTLSENVEGVLEITSQGQIIASLQPRDYVIQYPKGITRGDPEIFLGEDARTKYEQWSEELQAYRLAVAAYYEASRIFTTTLDDKIEEGDITSADDVLVSAPVRPAEFVYSSTKVYRGMPVTLSPGNYEIRLRNSDGEVVENSEKKLVVFRRDRVGVGYTAIPEDKWTTPEDTKRPDEIIYVRSNNVLYLEPYFESEYNEQHFVHLETPQAPRFGNVDWLWVKEGKFIPNDLQISHGNMWLRSISFEDYMVRQTPGKALGYEILEWQEGISQGMRARSPDFSAFRLVLNRQSQDIGLHLVGDNDVAVSGSSRTVDVVRDIGSGELWLPALLPVAVGIALVGTRRYTLRTRRAAITETSTVK
ncbi:MAG: hypothetical protein CL877_08360 [Dehalococcoidales bacterium]|jgi:hypothetical protein|nr:hypothetical protein [Dehalococcoidales bacterium]|tara:strand:+ start:6493 stop:7848 length:1356 start_codon:yes stop_codon:yes gene_type:complete